MSTTPASRVLHVIRRLNATGMAFGVLSLAERCAERGLGTAILTLRGLLDEECRRRKIKVIPAKLDLATRSFFDWAEWRSVVESVREFDPTVIHVHGTELALAAARLSRAVARPYVLTFDGFGESGRRVPSSRRWCRCVIATSEGLREDLVNVVRFPKDQIEVVAPGLRLSDYEEQPDRTGKDYRPVVGAMCRLLPSKGLSELLRAAKQVLAAPCEADFVIVGEGPHKRALWKAARELGIARYVTFAGAVSDHRSVLGALDVYVAPLLEETSQFATLEAMACARPVVATSVGSTYQIVQDGQTGLLVPRGNPEELGEAILKLLRDRRLARALGRRGRELVGERFNATVNADRVIECYRLPAASNGARPEL